MRKELRAVNMRCRFQLSFKPLAARRRKRRSSDVEQSMPKSRRSTGTSWSCCRWYPFLQPRV